MIADDDPIARRLREAVWADPDNDAPRMVFADYLLEHGDLLGELIAIQLARARTGDAITERELELVVANGTRVLQPAELWLRHWVIARGFLVAATPHGMNTPTGAANHPMWSTLERLTIPAEAKHPVFENPHLRLITLHTIDEVVVELSRRREPLPLRALAGIAPHYGLAVAADRLEAFDHAGAFDRVRGLSLDAWHLERSLDTRPILESRLVAQLDHLDLTFASARLDDLRLWRRWVESTRLARFSVHVPLAQPDPPPQPDESSWYARPTRATHFAYFEVERGGDHVTLQLDETTDASHVDGALAAAAELCGDRTCVIVQDVRDSNRIAERHAALIAGLRARFAEVRVTTGPVRPLTP